MENSPAPGFTPAWPTVILRSASAPWAAPPMSKISTNDARGIAFEFIDSSKEQNCWRLFLRLPLIQALLDELEGLVQAGAKAGDDDDGHEHGSHLKALRCHRAEVAESGRRAVLFGDDDVDQCAAQ